MSANVPPGSTHPTASSDGEKGAGDAGYRSIVERISEAILIAQDGVIKFANPAAAMMMGLPVEVLTQRPFIEFIHPDDRRMVYERHTKRLAGGGADIPLEYEFRFIDSGGAVKWARIRLTVHSWLGKPATLNLLTEITAEKRALAALEESEQKYRELVENAGSIIARLDGEGRITFLNQFGQRLFGYSEKEVVGNSALGVILPATPEGERSLGLLLAVLARPDGPCTVGETPSRTRSGEEIFVAWTTRATVGRGSPDGVLCVGTDITARKRVEDQLSHLSTHDPLTGARNRVYFEERIRAHHGAASVVMCDVDYLKLINDSLGHEGGDRVLQKTAAVLRDSFREHDVVARIGGDEFAVLLGSADADGLRAIEKRIRAKIEKHNSVNPKLPLRLSIGSSLAETKGDPHDLLRLADDAMYRDKQANREHGPTFVVDSFVRARQARSDYDTDREAESARAAERLSRAIDAAEDVREQVRLLAEFRDVGMVALDPSVATPEDDTAARHCEVGDRIARAHPRLGSIAPLILAHHERYDGKGMPRGVGGEDIPLPCRILAIAETWARLTRGAPNQQAIPHAEALAAIEREASGRFDPKLVARFITLSA